MFGYSIQVTLTVLVISLVIVIRMLSKSAISRALRKFNYTFQRRRMLVRLLNLFVSLLGIFLVSSIWGVKESDLFLFISSIMTALGIAFFAQWSLLSNISAGIILFFNHPIKLGNKIKVLDKDYAVEGVIKDITYYFVHIETNEGRHLTIPNSILLQKMIEFD